MPIVAYVAEKSNLSRTREIPRRCNPVTSMRFVKAPVIAPLGAIIRPRAPRHRSHRPPHAYTMSLRTKIVLLNAGVLAISLLAAAIALGGLWDAFESAHRPLLYDRAASVLKTVRRSRHVATPCH